ncbi:MAG TPA: xanthine dehydrogenase family protein molybdopterin-binding subunit [Chloroflexota bacterium]|nr:xanthine dehydrogenase family protein molybdopterin-binding subunit [Chloroflexota bacterium]
MIAEPPTGRRWVGSSPKRKEDPRLLSGTGRFVDDYQFQNLRHAAILRSPFAHARIQGIDTSRAEVAPGVLAVITGRDVEKAAAPFSLGVSSPVKYYPTAIDKVRFVGEPVAVVVATSRYAAEDAAELIDVDYEPLPAVIDPELACAPDAPILHENVGTNDVCHREISYGDLDQAWREADLIVETGRLSFPKYSSVPLETYGVIAQFEQMSGLLTIWSNFHGPFIMHPVTVKTLGMQENKVRFVVPPDIGGSFGIKSSIFPYLALLGIASMHVRGPVKWIEDRREHLLASSSGTDRISYLSAAVTNDGEILGIKTTLYDNVGGYIRSPEPACTFRSTGNWVGAYKVRNYAVDVHDVCTNKMPTGPNRGYGCQQLYFGIERLVDKIAEALQLDPAEVRRRNLIPAEAMPYTTPTGGIYDSGDYPTGLQKVLELAGYEQLKEERDKARAEGRLFGIGVATVVDPSVSNLGYVTVAIDPKIRAREDYLPKSGAMETAAVKIDTLGGVTCLVNTTPQGQGHETLVTQIVADELGVRPEDINVVTEFDTFNRVWSIASGTYSSRFASIGASAFGVAGRKLKQKVINIAAHLLEANPADLDMADSQVFVKGTPEKKISIKRLAGICHWNPTQLPEDMDITLEAMHVYSFPMAKPPDELDRVNSSNTYGFIAEVVAVEIDPDTRQVQIRKYATLHDAGTIMNPTIVEGQIYGGALHGIAGALYEELSYATDGQMTAASFMDYLTPTACEAVDLDIAHMDSPSPITALGSKGLGESSTMTAPAVIAGAVADALKPLGIEIRELPLTPDKVFHLMEAAKKRTA